MAAPDHAEPIGEFVDCDLTFTCSCGYKGKHSELLGVDPDEDRNLWCPQCRSQGWVWD